jgi:hypothetical protein
VPGDNWPLVDRRFDSNFGLIFVTSPTPETQSDSVVPDRRIPDTLCYQSEVSHTKQRTLTKHRTEQPFTAVIGCAGLEYVLIAGGVLGLYFHQSVSGIANLFCMENKWVLVNVRYDEVDFGVTT